MMRQLTFVFGFFHASFSVFAQHLDSVKIQNPIQASGAVTLTNNGISLVPTFSLEKPAAVFDVAVRRKRLSFEPQLAFALEDAKPWYFIFWLRYKVVETARFKLGAGFHPGFVFSTQSLSNNGVAKDYLTSARFFVGELVPTYVLNKNTNVGIYYLHSRGFNSDLRQLNFLELNCSFTNIPIGKKLLFRISPQVYYLKTDDLDGWYLTSNVGLSRKGWPVSVSAIVNKKIQSEIVGRDLVWNLSLIYSY